MSGLLAAETPLSPTTSATDLLRLLDRLGQLSVNYREHCIEVHAPLGEKLLPADLRGLLLPVVASDGAQPVLLMEAESPVPLPCRLVRDRREGAFLEVI